MINLIASLPLIWILAALALIPLAVVGYNHAKRVIVAMTLFAVILLQLRRNILLNQKVKQDAQDRKDISRANAVSRNSDRDSNPNSLRHDDGFKRD